MSAVSVLDDVIRVEYVRFDRPVDEIVADPRVAAEFARRVRVNMVDRDGAEIATVNRRLLTLRKRGEEKGGLPRIRREYHGRKTKPR